MTIVRPKSPSLQKHRCNKQEMTFLVLAVRKHYKYFDMDVIIEDFDYTKPTSNKNVDTPNLLDINTDLQGTAVSAYGAYAIEKWGRHGTLRKDVDNRVQKQLQIIYPQLLNNVNFWLTHFKHRYDKAKTQKDRLEALEDWIARTFDVRVPKTARLNN